MTNQSHPQDIEPQGSTPKSRRRVKHKARKPVCDKYGKTARRRQINRIVIITLWVLWVLAVAAVIGTFALIYNGKIGYMPDLEDLKSPTNEYASIVYSADDVELGRFYSAKNNRVYAEFNEIPNHLIDALVATEDARFFEHSGIDLQSLPRVFIKSIVMRDKSSGGGSTITQQLAKQLYTKEANSHGNKGSKRMVQKPVEWMIALKLERMYSKEEILKLYLNQFDFLYNAVGVKSAAKTYFNKDIADLTIEEAAVLVGMVKNPDLYNPLRHPERSIERRNVVIDQMRRNHKIDNLSDRQVDSLKSLPITLDFNRIDHNQGLAPYFRERLRLMLTAKKPNPASYLDRQIYIDDSIMWADDPLYGWIEKNPKPDGSKYNLYTDGLRIYTTLDSRMQRYAERAVNEHMASLQARFFKEKEKSANGPYSTNKNEIANVSIPSLIRQAIVNSDRYQQMKRAGYSSSEIDEVFDTPVRMDIFSYDGVIDTIMSPRDSVIYHQYFLRTGFISMDPKNGHIKAYVGGPDFKFFKYDYAGTGRRQVGSTFKPFLYAYAMENGFTPCSQFLNSQPILTDNLGRPWMPRNSGSARVDEMVDLRWALTNSNNWISARLMNEFDPAEVVRFVHNFGVTSHLDPVLALCLGTSDISVREMADAYTVFANNGMRATPIYVSRIEDASGNILAEFSTTHTRVMSEKGLNRILSVLLNVVDSGTGNRLRRAPYNLTAQTGGKTGTTNYNADGWFMAITPKLVSATWVGGDNRYIHFNTMKNGQGAEMALPIYGKYIRQVYDSLPDLYSQKDRFILPPETVLCEGDKFDEEDDIIEVQRSFNAFD